MNTEVVEILSDIFERADAECYYRSKNREHQGNWRIVMLQSKRALKTLKAPIPQTMKSKLAP